MATVALLQGKKADQFQDPAPRQWQQGHHLAPLAPCEDHHLRLLTQMLPLLDEALARMLATWKKARSYPLFALFVGHHPMVATVTVNATVNEIATFANVNSASVSSVTEIATATGRGTADGPHLVVTVSVIAIGNGVLLAENGVPADLVPVPDRGVHLRRRSAAVQWTTAGALVAQGQLHRLFSLAVVARLAPTMLGPLGHTHPRPIRWRRRLVHAHQHHGLELPRPASQTADSMEERSKTASRQYLVARPARAAPRWNAKPSPMILQRLEHKTSSLRAH